MATNRSFVQGSDVDTVARMIEESVDQLLTTPRRP